MLVRWRDDPPKLGRKAAYATAGYFFLWGLELIFLYFLVKSLGGPTEGFLLPAAAAVAWTLVSVYGSVHLLGGMGRQSTLILGEKEILIDDGQEIPYRDVGEVLVGHDGDGFAVKVRAGAGDFTSPLRNRKGFLAACRQIGALKGKVRFRASVE